MSWPSLSCVPFAVFAWMPCLVVSSGCVRVHRDETPAPLVPMVAPIPVAPAPFVATPAPSSFGARASVLADVVAPADAQEPPPSAPSVPSVVLVDELPYRWSVEKAKAEPEHPRANSKRHGRRGRPYHPAPGIIVDVTEAQGVTTAADIQRSARNVGYWPFRRCYEEGLRRDQALSGSVSIDMTLGAGGAVERTNVASATLRDESVVLCVAREASHLALSLGGPPTKAKMVVTLATGDGPVPVPQPVPRAGALREVLRASWPAVAQCYVSGLAKHADAGGRLELRFRTRANGEIVEVAEEGEPRFGDVDVTRCVLGVYRTSKLSPDIGMPGETSFAYAMHFEAAQR